MSALKQCLVALQVPVDQLLESLQQRYAGDKAEFTTRFCAVDRVASIVPGPISHVADQTVAWVVPGGRRLWKTSTQCRLFPQTPVH